MHKALHPRDDVILCRWRRLAIIEDSVDESIQQLKYFNKKGKEKTYNSYEKNHWRHKDEQNYKNK